MVIEFWEPDYFLGALKAVINLAIALTKIAVDKIISAGLSPFLAQKGGKDRLVGWASFVPVGWIVVLDRDMID